MGHKAVYYFDVLGFRHLAGGTVRAVADSLTRWQKSYTG